MANIDVGGGGRHGKRSNNIEVPLVPFIDFLLCLIAFLLVTAVWSQMARLNANANVPGPPDSTEPKAAEAERELHVEIRDDRRFQLVWKEGPTIVSSVDVDRLRVDMGSEGDYRYPVLAERIAQEWRNMGTHRSPSDPKFDRAVLHTDNAVQFSDLIAVIDAVNQPQRDIALGPEMQRVPAFNVTFAVN
jgi:biopolymer transport protein ExbD